jgi:hypothetical protein
MSKLFRVSRASHDRLLRLTSEQDRLYAVLRNGAMLDDKVVIVCSDRDAEALLITMKVVCPDEAVAYPVD